MKTYPTYKTRMLSLCAAVAGWIGVIVLSLGSSTARATTFDVSVGDGGFRFTPSSLTIKVGDTVRWTFASSGHTSTSGTPSQPTGLWDSGFVNTGGTFSFTFNSAGSFPYFCTAHGVCCGMVASITVAAATPSPTPTPTATPSPSPTATPSQTTLANISTRLSVQTGDNVLIGGFIVTGSEPKKVIVRAIGPSLTGHGVTGALGDPTLELHTTNTQGKDVVLETNDNWMDSDERQDIIDSTVAPTNDLESAIVRTLDPGSYTAVVRGVNSTTGIALVEVFDLDLNADSILANISTRGFVQTDDNVMIAGLIIVGPDSQRVLLRGIGPSLPVTGALADPILELHNKDGAVIVSNDDWKTDQEDEIKATTIPPTNDKESAIVQTLTPDSYTAVLRGKNNTTGVALVEAYQLDN